MKDKNKWKRDKERRWEKQTLERHLEMAQPTKKCYLKSLLHEPKLCNVPDGKNSFVTPRRERSNPMLNII